LIKLSFVQKRILSIAIILFSFYLLNTGCAKFDTTDIGSDLLPAVDNVHTFETILPITTVQGIFSQDSTVISRVDDHVLGKINNDPLFGTTKADIYAQFKPTFFPYYYGNAGDTIVGFDSVVLCLSYKGFWGDSLVPMQVEVKDISLSAGGLWDSLTRSRNVNFAPSPLGAVLGSTTVDFTKVGNYVVYANKRDSVRNHIRIKLTNSTFTSMLFSLDSAQSGIKNGFYSDSVFRKFFQKGLAIQVNSGGNGLMYTNLTDSLSRLEIHYRKKNGGAVDTTFSSFKMIGSGNSAGTFAASVTANNIVRGRAGYPISSPASTDIYLQAGPGSYANLTIPALDTLSNRIVHRAEIIIEQVPTNFLQDSLFSAPDFLYLDLVDTGAIKWKPIYFDLNPNTFYDPDFKIANYFPTGGVDFFYFGGYGRYKADPFGNSIRFYNFNITRYVQQIVTKHTTNYTLRLFAPYSFTYPQHYFTNFGYNNKIATGRVRVGSGTNPNYRMRLRIIYSKI
jgi:Domain of unknown function (DUF4270)